MSEDSKRYRAAMKAKAERMGGSGDPHQHVDASGWTPPPAMNTEAPTGPRPVSKRRNYKRGGMVEGKEARHHAGRRPRKAGGKALVDDFINRDVKEANEAREGIKHEGGMKRGGRAKRANGGGLGILGPMAGILPSLIASQMGGSNTPAPYSPGTPGQTPMPGKKRGGRTEGREHRDMGGPLAGPLSQGIDGQGRMNFSYPAAKSPAQSLGLKGGGKADDRPRRADAGRVGRPWGAYTLDELKGFHGKEPDSERKGRMAAEIAARESGASKPFSTPQIGRPADPSATPFAIPKKAAGGVVKGHPEGCMCDRCRGGRVERASGGGATYKGQFSNEDGGRQPKARGGKLDAKERDALPKREFGEPGSRKYPMPDKSHAANAKARASQQEHKGRISKSTEQKIDAKADRVLGRKEGGRLIEEAAWGRGEHRGHRASGGRSGKGKMSVNIVIAPGHPQAPAMGAPMPPPGPGGPPVPLPPRPPTVMPVGVPTPGMGAAPPPMMPPGGMPPQMPMRKRGGLVDGGAGGGLGRLEKIRDYGDNAWDAEERR